MIFADTRSVRRKHSLGSFDFTAAELQAWADVPATDPGLAVQLVKQSITPLAQQPAISCPPGYVFDQSTGQCHLIAAAGTSPWLIFGGLAAGALLFLGKR